MKQSHRFWPPAASGSPRSDLSLAEIFQATEVPVDEREIVIARYREVAGNFVGPCFTKLPDPKDHPVFQVGQVH